MPGRPGCGRIGLGCRAGLQPRRASGSRTCWLTIERSGLWSGRLMPEREAVSACTIEPPGPPLDIEAHLVDRNLTVRWRSPETGGPVEKYYVDRTIAGERYPAISSGTLTQPGHPITGRHHLNQAWRFSDSFWHDGDRHYSYTLYDDSSKNTDWVLRLHYTSQVRLVALNCAGFAASEPASVPTIASPASTRQHRPRAAARPRTRRADSASRVPADQGPGYRCRPHSVLSESAQRPERGSAPASAGLVHGIQPIDG